MVRRILLLLVLTGLSARAQFPAIQLNSLSPLGGKAGSEFEITLGGGPFERVDRLLFSHPGINAKPVVTEDEFLKRPVITPGKFLVNIKGDVPPGLYEARVAGFVGISNARRFLVESIPVFRAEVGRSLEKAVALPIDQAWYGSVNKDELDYFVFEAKKDQSFEVDCMAEQLDSKLDAALQVCDALGNPLVRSNDEIGRDPRIRFTAPADGKYIVRVHDFTYGGGAEFFYRLVISQRPQVHYLWPPAGIPGQKSSFTLHGLNLPGAEKAVELTLPADCNEPAPGGRPAGLTTPGVTLQVPGVGPVWVGRATAPVVIEQAEANDRVEQAQGISWPAEVAGRFEKNHDVDWYAFDLKAKDVVRLELISERMGNPTDPLLRLYRVNRAEDGSIKADRILEQDDFDAKTGGAHFGVRSRDAEATWTADKDGRYAVQVINQFSRGAPHYVYRLSVRKPAPDFQLMATAQPLVQDQNKPKPYGPVMFRGGGESLTVHVLRRDGFKGAVRLRAEGLPEGITVRGAEIAEAAGSAKLLVSSKPDAAPWSGTFRIIGEADVEGKALRREAQFATLLWPINNLKEEYWRSRLAGPPALGMIEVKESLVVKATEDKAWETSLAGVIEIPVKLEAKAAQNIKITPMGIPGMGDVPNITIKKGEQEGKLKLDFAKKGKNNFAVGGFSFVLGAEVESQIVFAGENAKTDAEADKKTLEQLHQELGEGSKKADEARQKAQQARDQARKDIPKKEALTEEERKQQLAAAEKTFTDAEQAAKNAKETMTRAKAAIDAAGKRIQKVAEQAKPRKVKYLAYSAPIEVTLVPTPFRITAVEAPKTIQVGSELEFPVKLERLFNYEGTIEVLVELPKGQKGLSIAKVDLAKGQAEAKLKFSANKEAPPGELTPTLVVRTKLNNQTLEEKRELVLRIEAVPEPPKPPAEKPAEEKPAEAPAEAKPEAP